MIYQRNRTKSCQSVSFSTLCTFHSPVSYCFFFFCVSSMNLNVSSLFSLSKKKKKKKKRQLLLCKELLHSSTDKYLFLRCSNMFVSFPSYKLFLSFKYSNIKCFGIIDQGGMIYPCIILLNALRISLVISDRNFSNLIENRSALFIYNTLYFC